ncbi:MAG: type II toxin-antitoxin system VapC family toxin [Tepidisphaeraceae bacterium]
MKILDVNVLIYAFRPEPPQHAPVRAWLERLVQSNRPFGVPDIVLAGFVRTITRKPFDPPSTPQEAWGFVDVLASMPQCTIFYGSPEHFAAFRAICKDADVRGNLLTDAYIAAHAIMSDGEIVSCDDDFSKFPGLTWRNPIDDQPRTNPR